MVIPNTRATYRGSGRCKASSASLSTTVRWFASPLTVSSRCASRARIGLRSTADGGLGAGGAEEELTSKTLPWRIRENPADNAGHTAVTVNQPPATEGIAPGIRDFTRSLRATGAGSFEAIRGAELEPRLLRHEPDEQSLLLGTARC